MIDDMAETFPRGQTWLSAPPQLRLDVDEVHVWRASLEQDPEEVEALRASLSADERRRADRFHFERDRRHFTVGRGVLRDVLSRYLGGPPAALGFSLGEFGKPALSGDDGGLRFNLSHSHGLALCAVTRGREVGVDVEHLRDDFAGVDIAERFFSPAEVAALLSLPAHQRTRAFFDCWTRKEAYIKALGEGLSHPLHLFTVSLKPGEPARLVSTDDPREAARWSVVELSPREGYAAALAIEGSRPAILLLDWGGRVSR